MGAQIKVEGNVAVIDLSLIHICTRILSSPFCAIKPAGASRKTDLGDMRMKITKIEVLKVKTTRPAWRPVFCRVYTDEGIYGDGEAALAYGKAAEAGFSAVKEFSGMILGMDPLKNEVIWEHLYKSTFWGQNGGPVVFAAIGALDMALWDIKGKYYREPIHQLLGGACRLKLRSYACLLYTSYAMPSRGWS